MLKKMVTAHLLVDTLATTRVGAVTKNVYFLSLVQTPLISMPYRSETMVRAPS